MTHNSFTAANILAPVPGEDGTREDWTRYHAALAFAAFALFHREVRTIPAGAEPGSRPDLGWLSELAVSSLHAAILLTVEPDDATRILWQLSPGYGALNGEAEEWLTDILDRSGINPADIDPRYEAEDFRSPSVAVMACDCIEYQDDPSRADGACTCGHDMSDHESDEHGTDGACQAEVAR